MGYIFHKGKFYQTAGTWNELTGKQLVQVMGVLCGNDSLPTGRLKLLRILLQWSWWKLVLTCGMHRLLRLDKINLTRVPARFGRWLDNTERIATAAEDYTAFLFEANKLTKQLLPNVGGWYGPDSSLGNMKMAEFCFCENYFIAWRDTKNPAHLNRLVAILYRPGKKKYDKHRNELGDIRIDFNPNSIEQRIKKVDKWPLNLRLAICNFYEGCREEKMATNPRVFDEASPDAGESLYGLWSVMRSVAKAGHFGDFDKVQEQYVDTILMELNEAIVEAEKMEAEMEAARRPGE